MIFKNDFIGNDLDADKTLNSLGHRCKELTDLNLKNYILFAGDNIALGFGTAISNTFPYITSQQLGVDYYNLCVFNGGLDSVRYNLLSWFSQIKQKPKALVISCEFTNSLIVSDQNFTYFKPIDLQDEDAKILLDAGNTTGFFYGRHVLADIQLGYACNVPIYQIIFEGKTPIFQKNAINIKHDGYMFDHVKISNTLTQEISKITTQMLP